MDKVDELFNKGVEKWSAAKKGQSDYELNLSMAESFVRRAIEQRKSSVMLSTYSRILSEMGQLKEAAQYAQEALRLDNNCVSAWVAQYEAWVTEHVQILKGDSLFKGIKTSNSEDRLNKAARGLAEAYNFSIQEDLDPEELLNITEKAIRIAEIQRKVQLQSKMLYTAVLQALQAIPYADLSDQLQELLAVADSVIRTQKSLR